MVSATPQGAPDAFLRRIGLRSLVIPVKWWYTNEDANGQTHRWSRSEPWLGGLSESWRMDNVSLGMRRAHVQGILGIPTRHDSNTETYATGIVVHYSRGGFVRGLEGGSTVTHDVHLGYHNLSQGPWHIGRPVEYLAELQRAHRIPIMNDGVMSLRPWVRFTLEKGAPTRFEFLGDPAVFDALDAAED